MINFLLYSLTALSFVIQCHKACMKSSTVVFHALLLLYYTFMHIFSVKARYLPVIFAKFNSAVCVSGTY